ncbi:hypothetical protein ATL51_2057 [Pseudonocardia alni]|jgi:hypothetical protein|uniref:Uncharacterized protein n=1 Tax=Pseudonocardia alni TaxID=33907 RepID=A0A852W6G5_PSEA5|nr:hypothetical protein [Pseudonocardia antarctica]NYG04090.1 hypothetical protein [Pseudonocardia antarctica]PKB30396.1 hypothetical protein ATL51_2057 [Pseudonocardia alni]
MERWRVGVLRSGAESVAWTDHGEGQDRESARDAAVYARVLAEGRQEFRVQVAENEAYVYPGETGDGELELTGIRDVLPQRYSR